MISPARRSHGLLTSRATIVSQPTQTQGLTSFRPDLDRDLMVGAANAAGLDFDSGR